MHIFWALQAMLLYNTRGSSYVLSYFKLYMFQWLLVTVGLVICFKLTLFVVLLNCYYTLFTLVKKSFLILLM